MQPSHCLKFMAIPEAPEIGRATEHLLNAEKRNDAPAFQPGFLLDSVASMWSMCLSAHNIKFKSVLRLTAPCLGHAYPA